MILHTRIDDKIMCGFLRLFRSKGFNIRTKSQLGSMALKLASDRIVSFMPETNEIAEMELSTLSFEKAELNHTLFEPIVSSDDILNAMKNLEGSL